MSTPLTEVSRVKLLPAYIGDVRAWKADDAAETIIFAVKNPAVDSDDTSFYALPRGAYTNRAAKSRKPAINAETRPRSQTSLPVPVGAGSAASRLAKVIR